MTINLPVLQWSPTSEGGLISVTNLDASIDNTYRFAMQGTDPNGDRVIPAYMVIDNLNNNSTVRVQYSNLATYSVSPYTRKKFPLLANLQGVTVTATLGTVGIIFANFDPGIPDDLNQYALSSGSAFSSTTWDPIRNTSTFISLDATNLIASYTNGGVPNPPSGGLVVSDVAKTTGKLYFEPRWITNANQSEFGIAIQTIAQPNNGNGEALGVTNDSLGISSNGTVRLNLAGIGNAWTNGAPTDGNSTRVAVNLTAGLFWAAKLGQNWNNSGTADPATGTGGFSIAGMTAGAKCAACGCGQQTTVVMGVNFGSAPFLNPIPAGFTPWN